jgi:pimeloyl-ACP methyl ester carboxylesterase
MGWSDPGPGVIPVGLLADDLERLTIRAGLRPPFILVPASLGGLTVELFTRRHPDQVAGLVFVDAGNSVMIQWLAPQLTWTRQEGVCLLGLAARTGVLRMLDPFRLRKDPSEAAAQSISLLYRAEPVGTVCGLVRGLPTTMQEFGAAPPLPPDIPLTVLVHERPDGLLPPGFGGEFGTVEREWLSLQQRFAASSRHGTWRVVPGSDHLIGSSQPHAVASAVIEMLRSLRAK